VEFVLEFHDFIGMADNIHDLLLIWLQDAVALDNLPDRFLILGESSEFSIDARFVRDADLLVFVF